MTVSVESARRPRRQLYLDAPSIAATDIFRQAAEITHTSIVRPSIVERVLIQFVGSEDIARLQTNILKSAIGILIFRHCLLNGVHLLTFVESGRPYRVL